MPPSTFEIQYFLLHVNAQYKQTSNINKHVTRTCAKIYFMYLHNNGSAASVLKKLLKLRKNNECKTSYTDILLEHLS